jgi:preprotein translocase SecE subunit
MVKIKKPQKLAKLQERVAKAIPKKPDHRSVEDNLRPESTVAKAINKTTEKAKEVGAKEVINPTPKKGILAKRVNPFYPIYWIFKYIKDSIKELKQVSWPDRRTTWRLTGAVFLFSAVMALFLFGVDAIFAKLFEVLFIK